MTLPESIAITEVAPRDGFQNIEPWIPTDRKTGVIESLIRSGVRRLEVTSFVHPKFVPQMKDAAEVFSTTASRHPDVELIALVPNLKGAQAARDAGVKNITYVISASEAHNVANVRKSVRESFDDLGELRRRIPGLRVKLDIATAFGCPFAGKVPVENVLDMMDASRKLDIEEICLCDTIGVANPRQVEQVLERVIKAYPDAFVSLHLHDTRGMALANILTAMRLGIRRYESAVGGLGGCPFAPGAAGNVATEDLVNMVEEMGVDSGLDLDRLLACAREVKGTINPNLPSHMVNIQKQDCSKGEP